MEVNREIHTMIVWSKAINYNSLVEKELIGRFNLLSKIKIEWDKNYFIENLKVFYSHSQMSKSESDFDKILKNKIEHCGDEAFYLYVLEDLNPVYDFRPTSSGNRKVNSNIFDLKLRLRDDVGGGHKIHASDSTFESNKDLTLLLGLNANDFSNSTFVNFNPIEIKNNCLGVGGYKNIEQFFYVLNNSISYCVLRNYECLPYKYNIKGHGDIDLLVENLNYIKYLTLAKSYYPEISYRVHYGIEISNKTIPFDFRYVGDNYYDINWQQQILNSVTYHNSLIKVPNNVNHFYSLMYHAYVQKRNVARDYCEKLEVISKSIRVNYKTDFSLIETKLLLDNYLKNKNFDYTIPVDKTVYFNRFFLNFDNNRLLKFGKLLSTQQSQLGHQLFFTEVYENQNSIVKFGSELIIKNEIFFLSKLNNNKFFPQVFDQKLDSNNFYVIIEKLEGVTLDKALDDKLFWKTNNIRSFINQLLVINDLLIKNNIMHRDVRPQNILINFNNLGLIEVKIIDFGWSSLFSDLNHVVTPTGLGSNFRYPEGGFSDLYSFAKVLSYVFKGFSFRTKLVENFNFKPKDYDNLENLSSKVRHLSLCFSQNNLKFNSKDLILLYVMKNKFIFENLLKIKRFLNIKLN